MTGDSNDLAQRLSPVIRDLALFAIRARRLSETVQRGVDLVCGELRVPTGALVGLSGQGHAVVVYACGLTPPEIGSAVSADAEVLSARVLRGPIAQEGRSGLSVRVDVDGEPWGRLLVADDRDREFSRGEEEVVRMVAAVLGAAVQRDHADQCREAVALLDQFALASDDVAATSDRGLDVVRQMVAVPGAALVRFLPGERTVVRVVRVRGPATVEEGKDVVLSPSVAQDLHGPEHLIISDRRVDGGPHGPDSLPGRWVACLAVPVTVGDQVWGRLVAFDVRPRTFSPRAVELLSSVAQILGAALWRDPRGGSLSESSGTAVVRKGLGHPYDRQAAGDSEARSTVEVALLDRDGVIVWVNQAWEAFCDDNGGDRQACGAGVSYLDLCDGAGDRASSAVGAAIRTAIAGGLPSPLRVVVPCHSPSADRWFDVLISSRWADDGSSLGATITLSQAKP